MRVLEIGCAPAKQLAWVAKTLGAKVSGVDYSEPGIEFSRRLFESLGIDGDLRCEDIFSTTFSPGSFDFVYSVGVIEHFDDATWIVRQHVILLKPGSIALIIVPNYHDTYGKLQNYNLDIMTCRTLTQLIPTDLTREAMAFRAGRLDPWLINFHKKWPRLFAKVAFYFFNGIGVLQPVDISALCPWLVLKLIRSKST